MELNVTWIIWILLCTMLAAILLALGMIYVNGGGSLINHWISKRVLLVTAHPDDECMFFGPALSALSANQIDVHLLCLSNGDWYGQGQIREAELLKSWKTFGFNSSTCHVLNDNNLKDSPNITWKSEHILKHVQNIVNQYSIDVIITFDGYGVSGHHNHISISSALKEYHVLPDVIDIPVYQLESINILRKYAFWLDAIFTMLTSSLWVATPLAMTFTSYQAMFDHGSQLMWFRYLYLLSSRYMFINSFKIITRSA